MRLLPVTVMVTVMVTVTAMALALAPSVARADLAAAARDAAPLSTTCVAAIREVARALGLGHPEENRGPEAVEIAFSNGAADCDADAFSATVEDDRRRARRWITTIGDGAIVSVARDGRRRLTLSAGFSISKERTRAAAFIRGVREALARCDR